MIESKNTRRKRVFFCAFYIIIELMSDKNKDKKTPMILTYNGLAVIVSVVFLLQIVFVGNIALIRSLSSLAAQVLPAALNVLTNNEREQNGLAKLVPDPLLSKAAQLKADDMAKNAYFAHKDPKGRMPWYWMDLIGYKYSYAGENLAINFTESKDVVQAWMNSTMHRANILNRHYDRVGVGISKGEYKGKKVVYVVQFFAKKPEIYNTYSVGAGANTKKTSGKSLENFKGREEANFKKIYAKKQVLAAKTRNQPELESHENSAQDSRLKKQSGNEGDRVDTKSKEANDGLRNAEYNTKTESKEEYKEISTPASLKNADKRQVEVQGRDKAQKDGFRAFLAVTLTSPSVWYVSLMLLLVLYLSISVFYATFTHSLAPNNAKAALLTILFLLFLSYLNVYGSSGIKNTALPSDSQNASVIKVLK